MLRELDELGMGASYVTELGCAELGEVCLNMLALALSINLRTYVNVESDDGVFASCSFQRSHFGL